MILSFQRQVLEEQMAKTKQREMRKDRTSPRGSELQDASIDSSAGSPNLFLKNSSSTIPPRRQQLASSNV